jgi:hypothetical protein
LSQAIVQLIFVAVALKLVALQFWFGSLLVSGGVVHSFFWQSFPYRPASSPACPAPRPEPLFPKVRLARAHPRRRRCRQDRMHAATGMQRAAMRFVFMIPLPSTDVREDSV